MQRRFSSRVRKNRKEIESSKGRSSCIVPVNFLLKYDPPKIGIKYLCNDDNRYDFTQFFHYQGHLMVFLFLRTNQSSRN